MSAKRESKHHSKTSTVLAKFDCLIFNHEAIVNTRGEICLKHLVANLNVAYVSNSMSGALIRDEELHNRG